MDVAFQVVGTHELSWQESGKGVASGTAGQQALQRPDGDWDSGVRPRPEGGPQGPVLGEQEGWLSYGHTTACGHVLPIRLTRPGGET